MWGSFFISNFSADYILCDDVSRSSREPRKTRDRDDRRRRLTLETTMRKRQHTLSSAARVVASNSFLALGSDRPTMTFGIPTAPQLSRAWRTRISVVSLQKGLQFRPTIPSRFVTTTQSSFNKSTTGGYNKSSYQLRRLGIKSNPPPPPIAKQETKESSDKLSTTLSSDPPILTWVDDYLPTSIQPYARLARVDKPIGTWLLLWPCFWSTAIAVPSGQLLVSLPDPYLLSLFTVGAFVMRGAGCTINDMWDQDFDRRVARTSSRPLAAGDLTQGQALGFLAVQLSAGLGVLLSLPHTMYCFVWGVSSLPLVVAYPLMKRYTNWPQLVLGLTFNWGAWMGWAATHGEMDFAVIGPLYLSGVTWTLVYDTIYANQDKKEDVSLGLKSTALTFGSDETRHKQILHSFAALTWLQWLLVGHFAADMSLAYNVGVTTAYSHLIWQIQTADLENPHNLAERFRSNATVGGMIFASIVAGKLTGDQVPELIAFNNGLT
jgi:4-hydroxybenzoate polyprenyltransferase